MLHQIWRALSEGILVLEEGGAERRLFFLRGVPVAYQSDDPADGLVGWLAASGRLDEAQRAHALEGDGERALRRARRSSRRASSSPASRSRRRSART